MGYFDFLGGVQQEPSKEKKPWTGRIPPPEESFTVEQPVGPPGLPEDDGSTKLGVTADEPKAPKQEHVEKRASATSKVFAAADEVIDSYYKDTGVPSELVERFKREVRQSPENAAKYIEKTALQHPSHASRIPAFRKLEGAIRELTTVKATPQEEALQKQLTAKDVESHLPALVAQQEAQTAKIEQMGQQFSTDKSVSQREEAERRESIMRENAILESLTQKVDKYRSMGLPPKPTQAAQPMREPSSTASDPQAGFNSIGINRRETVKTIQDAMDGLAQTWKDGFNPDAPVNFQAGLQSILPFIWPDGGMEAMREFAKNIQIRPENSEKTSADKLNPNRQEEGEKFGREMEMRDKNAEIRQSLKDLANAEEMQSWVAIIAYGILSMLISPRLAFQFFSNAARKNTLRYWIGNLQRERRDLVREREREEGERLVARKEAARLEERQQDEVKADRRMFIQHQLIIARAKATHPEKSTLYTKLGNDFRRYTVMANDAQKIMQDPYEQDQAKKQKAAADYRMWTDKAKAVNGILEDLTQKTAEQELSEVPE